MFFKSTPYGRNFATILFSFVETQMYVYVFLLPLSLSLSLSPSPSLPPSQTQSESSLVNDVAMPTAQPGSAKENLKSTRKPGRSRLGGSARKNPPLVPINKK